MSIKVMIINSRNEKFEYNEDTIDNALNKYVTEQIGFGSSFDINRAQWLSIYETNQDIQDKIAIINGLCRLAKHKIEKVVTNYNYTIAYPADPDTYEGVIYKLSADNSSYSVAGFDRTYPRSVLNIVAEYPPNADASLKKPVTLIDAGAFENNKTLTDIYIPNCIQKIRSGAFVGCTSLTKIRFQGNFNSWQAICESDIFSTNYEVSPKFNVSSASLNGWLKENGKWYYYEDNNVVTKAWRTDTDGVNDCYLGSDGAMMINAWIQDSVGWCYVGADGHKIVSKWLSDSTDWCYLGADGYMVTDTWQTDHTGNELYIDHTGHIVRSRWKQWNTEWYYLDSDGYVTKSAWVQDSHGWCYVGTDGKMVKGTTINIGGTSYSFDSNGHWIE